MRKYWGPGVRVPSRPHKDNAKDLYLLRLLKMDPPRKKPWKNSKNIKTAVLVNRKNKKVQVHLAPLGKMGSAYGMHSMGAKVLDKPKAEPVAVPIPSDKL